MNEEQTRVMDECVRGSHTGELNFPQIVGRLAAIGQIGPLKDDAGMGISGVEGQRSRGIGVNTAAGHDD